jgi:hypothetical protein
MKIVNREQFLQMPPNTVFSKYKPCILSDLRIKGESWGNDFLCQDIENAVECDNLNDFEVKLIVAEESGASVSFDFNCESRDGMFDDDQLFAVWESADVQALIERLQKCTGEHDDTDKSTHLD